MLLSSSQLIERTGVTMRQLDYWCTAGLILPVDQKNNPGSGHYRKFNEDIVPTVSLLVKMAAIFSRFERLETLKKVSENYYQGELDFGDGITLTWRI